MPVVRAFEAPCMVLSNKLQNIFARKFFSFFSLLAFGTFGHLKNFLLHQFLQSCHTYQFAHGSKGNLLSK